MGGKGDISVTVVVKLGNTVVIRGERGIWEPGLMNGPGWARSHEWTRPAYGI